MPTQSARFLVDAVTEEASRSGPPSSSGLRAQAAFVRALVDEIERLHPSDRRVPSLHEQLGDELSRLVRLVPTELVANSSEAVVDVLVVEDDEDEDERVATRTAVTALGYPCRTVATFEDALAEYEKRPAAIVLSDWNLAGKSGLDLCTALKRRDPQLYVILVTAHHDRGGALQGAGAGADDFLKKPVDLDELEHRLLAASRLVRAVRLVAALKERLLSTSPPPVTC